MAAKQFEVAGIGLVSIVKRRASRSVRLSIKANGDVMVSIPAWASYQTGLDFAASRQAWIVSQLPNRQILHDGQAVGKYHHLQLSPTRGLSTTRSLVSKTTIIVRYPIDSLPSDELVQTPAAMACIRALRQQANQLLPQRLQQLAVQHGFNYRSVNVKRMTSRWGSCDQEQHIVLNLFLMQLPWECIDYVLLHELTHTKVLRHGPPFWQAMKLVVPNLAAIRKQMRSYQPVLY